MSNKSNVNETLAGGLGRVGPVDGTVGEIDANDLFNLSRKDVLQRLNTFVQHVSERTYVNPHTPLAHLREKLSIIGIGVQMLPIVGDNGSIDLPLSQWGGVFNPYTGMTEDGISDKTADGYGLNLHLEWYKEENGRFNLTAEIVSAGDNDLAPEVEESFGAASASRDANLKKKKDEKERKRRERLLKKDTQRWHEPGRDQSRIHSGSRWH